MAKLRTPALRLNSMPVIGAESEQPVWQETIYPADPAVGADLVFTVDGAFYFLPEVLSFLFTTSAAVANRLPVCQIEDGNGRVLERVVANVAHTAGLAWRYTVADWGVNQGSAASSISGIPFKPFTLTPGMVIRLTAVLKDVGDQFSQAAFTMLKALTGPPERRELTR